MWRCWLCVLFVLCWSPVLLAGQVYGTLRDGGRGVAGVEIRIVQAAKEVAKGTTGPDGSYRITVNETGRCEFHASYKRQDVVANVASYATPVKYDFEFVMADGKYVLKAN